MLKSIGDRREKKNRLSHSELYCYICLQFISNQMVGWEKKQHPVYFTPIHNPLFVSCLQPSLLNAWLPIHSHFPSVGVMDDDGGKNRQI